MLNSATAGTSRTDQSTAWWSAGMGPHEQGLSMPAWAEYVERSTALSVTPAPVTGDWQQALIRCLEPLLATARQDLAAAGQDGPLAEEFLQRLGMRLLRLASRTLVLELARARSRGELAGETPAERFLDFTHRLVGGSELADFLAAYPVLARVLGEACRQSIEGHLELLSRLAEDREQLTTTLLSGTDPGPLLHITPGGDPHRGGRSTATLTFTNGQKLIYKPRPLDLHAHFNDLVHWLNDKTGLDLQTVHVLRRPGYGWLEYIDHIPCQDLTEVRRFYHRQGGLLALLYVLDGTDMHHENLIAHGDQPVLVDVETLFHPSQHLAGLPGQDPAHAALQSSVYRTALLPMLSSGENGIVDISGLGGDSGEISPINAVEWIHAGLDTMRMVRRPVRTGESQNRPRLDGSVLEPRDHEIALLAGFQAAYEAIAWHRSELLGPTGLIAACSNDEVRYVARATQTYASLLEESTHPTAMRDAAGRSELLDLLWDADPSVRRLVPTELSDLWAGDIPLFTARPDSLDVWASDGTRIPQFLAREGLAAVEAKIAGLSEVDQHRQQWLISATLATRPEPIVHACRTSRSDMGTAEADPDQLLAAATDIADEIMARAENGRDGRANWLGLELLDDHHWLVMPMGAGLSNGYTGVALFLAQVGTLTGAGKYSELARDAIRPLPQLLETLAHSPETAQLVGPGMHGLGGISYGLSRLESLLGDAELGSWLTMSLEIAGNLETDPAEFCSYSVGAAGGLTAMQAIQDHVLAANLASRYADELLAAIEFGARRENPNPDPGFTHGYQGLAWSLGRYGTPGDRYHAAAIVAADLDRQGAAPNPGWCSGDAGATLARLSAGVPADLEAYLQSATERPVLSDMSLCHGELGAVEPILWLAEGGAPAIEAVRRRRAGLVLAAVQQYGPQCGTPRGVTSPGLLTGLAGVGYGLLRLGFGSRIPSVLLLEPNTGDQRPSQH
ncbi:type 2 lanthipeptide synthetase LanM family protein [Kribbella sp. NPDC051620]|uniref:type 2 lanthipeptide synthetase LanM family protein n=1 Tax=Kribbella sp. NPDC051620 TaxID=3364120 RepID=UPI00379B849E